MNSNRHVRLISIGASTLLFPGVANADAGIPMLFLTLPAMIIALAPIIAVESIVVGRLLGTSAISKAKSVAIANVASTVIGLPLTWVALVAVQLISGGGSAYGLVTPTQKLLAVTWQAPWLIPYEGDLYWMVPAASLFLLAPFFFGSMYLAKHGVAHACEEAGDDLAGYALVTWTRGGDMHSAYDARHGPIRDALVPTLVGDAMNRHVAVMISTWRLDKPKT
jgi:hypothetical protein